MAWKSNNTVRYSAAVWLGRVIHCLAAQSPFVEYAVSAAYLYAPAILAEPRRYSGYVASALRFVNRGRKMTTSQKPLPEPCRALRMALRRAHFRGAVIVPPAPEFA